MIVLFDTCVVLDYLMNREPFSNDSADLIELVARREIEGFLSVKTLMDIHYILKKYYHDETKTRELLLKLTEIFEIIDSLSYCCLKSLNSNISDFEDAMMSETGIIMEADYIVTRNVKDYKRSKINIITPSKLVKEINRKKDSNII